MNGPYKLFAPPSKNGRQTRFEKTFMAMHRWNSISSVIDSFLTGGQTASALVNPGTQKEEHVTYAASQKKRCSTSQDERCSTPQRKRAWTQSTIVSSMGSGRSAGGNEENEEGGMGGGEFGQNKRSKRGETEKDELLMDVPKCASDQFSLSRTKAATRKNVKKPVKGSLWGVVKICLMRRKQRELKIDKLPNKHL